MAKTPSPRRALGGGQTDLTGVSSPKIIQSHLAICSPAIWNSVARSKYLRPFGGSHAFSIKRPDRTPCCASSTGGGVLEGRSTNNRVGSSLNNLKTGDVIEGLPHATMPVVLKAVTYQVQNEALLQWFAGQTPS